MLIFKVADISNFTRRDLGGSSRLITPLGIDRGGYVMIEQACPPACPRGYELYIYTGEEPPDRENYMFACGTWMPPQTWMAGRGDYFAIRPVKIPVPWRKADVPPVPFRLYSMGAFAGVVHAVCETYLIYTDTSGEKSTGNYEYLSSGGHYEWAEMDSPVRHPCAGEGAAQLTWESHNIRSDFDRIISGKWEVSKVPWTIMSPETARKLFIVRPGLWELMPAGDRAFTVESLRKAWETEKGAV